MTYANVVATLALIFAMTGSAVAATHYLITSTKQISPKALKELKADGTLDRFAAKYFDVKVVLK